MLGQDCGKKMDKLLKPVIRCFLLDFPNKRPKFSDLKSHVKSNFNMVDEKMFKEWVQKEFPDSFKFNE